SRASKTTNASHSKHTDSSEAKAKYSKRSLQPKSKDVKNHNQTHKGSSSKSTVAPNQKNTSKDNVARDSQSKPTSKDVVNKSKTVSDEKKPSRDHGKEERDIFARIAAGET